MKKVLLFGALGALGCLLGWGAGEVMLKFGLPWANKGAVASIVTPPPAEPPELKMVRSTSQVAAPRAIDPPALKPFLVESAPAPPPLDADLARRLADAGAHSGAVEVALKWYNFNDLDLHVIDPAGVEIYFRNPRAGSGGWLDVDKNAGSGPYTSEPVEHVFFPPGGAPNGHYKVYVVHYANHGGSDPSAYYVEVLANGLRTPFNGSIGNNGRNDFNNGSVFNNGPAWNEVCEFDVQPPPPPPPRLRLSVPSSLSVAQGGFNEFRVLIARGSFADPVSVRLKEPLEGVTIDTASIPGWSTDARLKVEATTNASPGYHSISLLAVADPVNGHVEDAANVSINVIKPPQPDPVFKISVPETMQVVQAKQNSFKLRVGRYFFPTPLPVTVHVDGTAGLSANPPQIAATADEGVVEVTAARHAEPGKHRVSLTAKSGPLEASAPIEVEVLALPPPPPILPMVGVIGAWTALLAIGLSLLLALGQSRYLNRSLLTKPGQSVSMLAGSALAGALAGAAGQALLAVLDRAHSPGSDLPAALAGLPPALGQVAGWLVLGALMGRGLAFAIPNLPALRASLAGGIGGLAGAGAFLGLTQVQGPLAGRIVGAVVLGFAIGSMVALSEVLFREAWLEIGYGKEIRKVNLGAEQISIGSDEKACTIFARNAPPVAFRYKIDQGRIVCTEGPTDKTFTVLPGDRRQAGAATITVCAPSKAAGGAAQPVSPRAPGPAAAAGAVSLRLSTGRTIPLKDGLHFSTNALPGLEPQPPGAAVALVTAHPQNPSLLGLKNLSRQTWDATAPNGERKMVSPGKTIPAANGTKINFGKIQGEMVA